MRKKIGIIGGGIFGCSIAIKLSQSFDVTIFEKESKILSGATYANHNRHHYGFHYPRSPETVRQCLESKKIFEDRYSDALFKDFENFYGVAKKNSNVSFNEYIKFLDELNLNYEIPELNNYKSIFDSTKLDGVVQAFEYVYDYNILYSIISNNLSSSDVKVKTNTQVVDIKIVKDIIDIYFTSNGSEQFESFDFLIDCTYGNTNFLRNLFNLEAKNLQHNLQELAVIRIKSFKRFGATIMDGMFPSILPYGNSKELYLFAHADKSQLKRIITTQNKRILNDINFIETNWNETITISKDYLPILESSEYQKSIIVDRVVDYGNSLTDSRISEIDYLGNKCWSIFSAKVITSELISQKISEEIYSF